MEIDFDPTQISYRQLLAVFWSAHFPVQRSWSRQYRSAIFYHDEAQRQAALESKREREARGGQPLFTDIEPATGFTLAEDYHQKYSLKRDAALLAELQAYYPDAADLVRSTAAARLNGYLGGHGTLADLKAEIDGLGLSERGRQALLRLISRRERSSP